MQFNDFKVLYFQFIGLSYSDKTTKVVDLPWNTHLYNMNYNVYLD